MNKILTLELLNLELIKLEAKGQEIVNELGKSNLDNAKYGDINFRQTMNTGEINGIKKAIKVIEKL